MSARSCERPLKWIGERIETTAANSGSRERRAHRVRVDASWWRITRYSSNNGAYPQGADAKVAGTVHVAAYKMQKYGFSRAARHNTGGCRLPRAVGDGIAGARDDVDIAAARSARPIEIRSSNSTGRSAVHQSLAYDGRITPQSAWTSCSRARRKAFGEQRLPKEARLGSALRHIEPTGTAGSMPS